MACMIINQMIINGKDASVEQAKLCGAEVPMTFRL